MSETEALLWVHGLTFRDVFWAFLRAGVIVWLLWRWAKLHQRLDACEAHLRELEARSRRPQP